MTLCYTTVLIGQYQRHNDSVNSHRDTLLSGTCLFLLTCRVERHLLLSLIHFLRSLFVYPSFLCSVDGQAVYLGSVSQFATSCSFKFQMLRFLKE